MTRSEKTAPRQGAESSSPRVARKVLGLAAVVAIVATVATWALVTALRPAEDPLSLATHTFVEVVEGTVESEINVNAVAVWSQRPVGVNRAAGVVTSIDIETGQNVDQGELIYTVDLQPVVVAEGSVPSFRPISLGVAGADVAQLQRMLADLGFPVPEPDGVAGTGTIQAVKEWQKSRGAPVTGIVNAGDVVFVPALPSRVSLDASVVMLGASLAGGEQVVNGLEATPTFAIPVTDAQAALMPTGTGVELQNPAGGTWEAVVGEHTRQDGAATVRVSLEGVDGAAVCGSDCEDVPVLGESIFTAKVVAVEPVTGHVVPSAALVTTGDGTIAVVDADGERHIVTVVQSARGMSVIEGVDVGLKVRAPATDLGGGS